MLKILQNYKRYFMVAAALALVIFTYRHLAAPESCALCGGLKRHAPCIVNLATGEVGELAIYSPHPTLVGEIASQQTGGTFALFPCAGLTAAGDADAGVCTVQLPQSRDTIRPSQFCAACRGRLSGLKGYALADLYDLNAIQVYPINDGAAYTIRGYRVCIAWDDTASRFHVRNSMPAP